MIKLFEAFSGYGSQSLALEKYGVEFQHVGIAEIDKYAIAAHKSLHGEVKNYGDISKIKVRDLPDMDLFTYSFPCQDISNAGKQRGLAKGSGTRSSLLWECEKVINWKRPKFLMMENVKNLVGKKNKPHFDRWLRLLEAFGYNNYWKVINAKWCGVPQNRERVFVVSILKEFDDGAFKFEEDFDSGLRLKDVLERNVAENFFLPKENTSKILLDIDFKNLEYAQIGCDKSINKPKTIDYANCITAREDRGVSKRKSEGTAVLVNVGNVNPSEKGMNGNVFDSNNLTPTITTNKGEGPKVLVKEATKKGYKEAYEGDSINLEHPNSKTRRGRVGNQVAQTLTTSCNQAVVENYKVRKLTPRECFRLMGLSDEQINKIQATIVNKKPISNSQQYKLAGNSIVVNCMKFLKNLEGGQKC